MRDLIRKHVTISVVELIKTMNPKHEDGRIIIAVVFQNKLSAMLAIKCFYRYDDGQLGLPQN